MAASRRFIHHFEQSDQSVQFLTGEGSFGGDVSDLLRGVNKFHLDPWVKVNPVKQSIEINAMRSGNVSQWSGVRLKW